MRARLHDLALQLFHARQNVDLVLRLLGNEVHTSARKSVEKQISGTTKIVHTLKYMS